MAVKLRDVLAFFDEVDTDLAQLALEKVQGTLAARQELRQKRVDALGKARKARGNKGKGTGRRGRRRNAEAPATPASVAPTPIPAPVAVEA